MAAIHCWNEDNAMEELDNVMEELIELARAHRSARARRDILFIWRTDGDSEWRVEWHPSFQDELDCYSVTARRGSELWEIEAVRRDSNGRPVEAHKSFGHKSVKCAQEQIGMLLYKCGLRG